MIIQNRTYRSLSKKQKLRIKRWLLAGRPWVECHYCGEHLALRTMTLDHVIPVARGGKNRIDNFVPACVRCNRMKSDIPYRDFLTQAQRIAA